MTRLVVDGYTEHPDKFFRPQCLFGRHVGQRLRVLRQLWRSLALQYQKGE